MHTQSALRRAALLTLCLLVPGYAQGSPINFWSGDGGDLLVNSITPGLVTEILPHPAWGDVSDDAGLAPYQARWISYRDTGYGAFEATNVSSRTVGSETAHFQRTFALGAPGIFTLFVLADDTATVRLTGPAGTNTLFTAFPGQLDPCAPGGSGGWIGCVDSDLGRILFAGLTPGSYVLDLYLFQTNHQSSGLQFAGQYSAAPVPEPASLLLLGSGLAALVEGRRRRRADRAAGAGQQRQTPTLP